LEKRTTPTESDFPPKLSQPARRALAGAGIQNLHQLTRFSQGEIRRLHGIGPKGLAQLRSALAERGLSFQKENRQAHMKQTEKPGRKTSTDALPKIERRPAHSYAAVRMQVPLPFGKYLQPAWAKVDDWLARQGLSHGPAIIRYWTTDMSAKLDIDVGFVTDHAFPASQGIVTDVLPSGRYATLVHIGPYQGKGVYKANVAIIEWAKTNGIGWKTSTIDGVEWWDSRVEWYFNDPATDKDPKKYKTELTFRVADDS